MILVSNRENLSLAMKKTWSLILFIFLSQYAFNQTMYFPPINGNTWDTLSPSTLGWCQERIDSMYHYLEVNNTKAFILLKDGKIVLEKYFGTQTQNSPWYWASAGKSLTASLIGIAQQEHYLSIEEPSSKYLGTGWTSCDANQENKITIRHQLTMTTGLDDGVPDYTCTLDTCLVCLADAGTRWAYHNAPYTLLDSVIESATGSTLNAFLNQTIKRASGMSGMFIKLDNNNVYYSTARSMARYGLLMLNKGKWADTPVLTDSAYFHQMTHSSQALNPSYGYLWWLNGQGAYMLPQSQYVFNGNLCPDAPDDMYAALGKNGQLLDIVPSKGIVFVRMGDAPDNLPVPFLMNNVIWQYINNLDCQSSAIHQTNVEPYGSFVISPNPTGDKLDLHGQKPIKHVEIMNANGQLFRSLSSNTTELTFNISDLTPGYYILSVRFADGQTESQKFVKK